MPPLSDLLIGAALALLGAWLPRRVAGTRWRASPALAIDLAMPAALFLGTFALSGRPFFSGVLTLSLGAGYGYADRAKRATLQEPIVYTDVFQAFDIFRHPHLALPFPNLGAVLLGAGATLGAYVALFVIEPRQWSESALLLLPLGLAGVALAQLIRRSPAQTQRFLHRLGASGEPQADARRCGPLATLWIHALLAGAERAARRDEVARGAPARFACDLGELAGPVVMVQSESFFDARRLHPDIDRELLPNFARACADGVQHGRLTVPCWGANTVRTEFAVLSGLAPATLGFDRFNPYHRFADAPVTTLAAQLRARGYRCLFLHPFDGRFYGRDRVFGHLGFDELYDEAAFPPDAARIEGFIGDVEVARVVDALLHRHGPKVFIFVVTMENHGPWHSEVDCEPPAAFSSALPAPERRALQRYLKSLRNADAMLGQLRTTLERDFADGTLVFYGDHLPGFARAYTAFGLDDRRSDYLVWRRGGSGARRNLAAWDLADATLRAAAGAPR